jgi:hypothetical protein
MIPTKTTREIWMIYNLRSEQGYVTDVRWVRLDDLKREIGLFCNRPIKERTFANMLTHFIPEENASPLVSTPGRSVEEAMHKLNERRARIEKKSSMVSAHKDYVFGQYFEDER